MAQELPENPAQPLLFTESKHLLAIENSFAAVVFFKPCW
jgi:hypothetical protein